MSRREFYRRCRRPPCAASPAPRRRAAAARIRYAIDACREDWLARPDAPASLYIALSC